MNINLSKSVYYDNYLKLLGLINGIDHGFVNYELKGKINKKYCNIAIEDVTQDAYCNIFTLKNLYSDNKIIINNIKQNGKYNLINLSNINPGTYKFISNPKINTKFVSEKNNYNVDKISKISQIDKILNVLDKAKSDDSEKIFSLKNKRLKNLTITDIPNVEIIYLKNLKIDSDKITIEYDSNDIKVVLINIDAEIIFTNKSKKMPKSCKPKNKKIPEAEVKNEESEIETEESEVKTEESQIETEESEIETEESEIETEESEIETEESKVKNLLKKSKKEVSKIVDSELSIEDNTKVKVVNKYIDNKLEISDETDEETTQESILKENFSNNSKDKCLKLEEMLIIGIILYLLFKLLVPERKIIKLNI